MLEEYVGHTTKRLTSALGWMLMMTSHHIGGWVVLLLAPALGALGGGGTPALHAGTALAEYVGNTCARIMRI